MINKISITNNNISSLHLAPTNKKDDLNTNPNFKGGAWNLILQGLQNCEKTPMVNVAVIDMLSAILPRTLVESMTNAYAGFEAFRRESSGLIVNCLLPGFITMFAAFGLNKVIMPKGSNLSKCWADGELINATSQIYKEAADGGNKLKNTYKTLLKNIEGTALLDKNNLTEQEIDNFAERLVNLTNEKSKRKDFNKKITELTKEIADKTHVYQNIKIKNKGEEIESNSLKQVLEDSTKYLKEYEKVKDKISIDEFAKKGKKLVKAKSLAGLAIILPLAASMQYINRWITKKMSGIDGAPIYDDFGKENSVSKDDAKNGLLKQKIISISSMIGVSLLSMMKLPSMKMLEFRSMFPSMDQARIISTTTFASRMAAADDKNELRESTVRDIATFLSLYFLGDYASKGAATIIQKKTGVKLLNETKALSKDAGFFKKIVHWIKDINVKASEEVFSNTAEELKQKGLKPTAEQEKIIKKEIKNAVNLRSACQFTNLGVSLILLGLVIPICTRRKTKKEAQKLAQTTDSSSCVSGKDVVSASEIKTEANNK